MARAAGFDNLNLDLMLGLPGQKPEQWARDGLRNAGGGAGNSEELRGDVIS